MTAPLMSREAIARLADAAAADWVVQPTRPRPANPFCQAGEPDHWREWNASFERSLVKHSAPEAEASA